MPKMPNFTKKAKKYINKIKFSKMEEAIKIKKQDLEKLVKQSLKLETLVNGGVDNWTGYSEVLNDPEYFDGFNSFNDVKNRETFFDDYCKEYIDE